MDIFITNVSDADNINQEVLKSFQKKKISNLQVRKTHCYAYFMVDKILNDVYKLENREIEFVNNKPYLKNREKYISITHSNDVISIAFSDFDCGIDIEIIKNRNYQEISDRMKFDCRTLEEFYEQWTLYEATYKLAGPVKNKYIYKYGNYCLCAVSSNIQEQFEIYIQNSKNFSKQNI